MYPAASRKSLMGELRKRLQMTVAEVTAFVVENKLYFGPNVDAIDFFESKIALGVVRFDVKNGVYAIVY